MDNPNRSQNQSQLIDSMSGVTSADAAAGIEAEMEQLEMAEMEGWAEVARVYHSGTLTPITALAFDPHHEAVWVGNDQVHSHTHFNTRVVLSR